ncbi:MAG: hypothetical protein ACREJC_14285, partial [Tepidisphaeraceae bacterium]
MSIHRPQVQIAFGGSPASNFDVRAELSRRSRSVRHALGLALLAWVAHIPSLLGNFLPGDQQTVTQNPALWTWRGLGSIWLSPQHLPQLYPVAFSAYLFEYQFFGGNPLGYHAVSLLLHGVVTILLWTALDRLEVPGAWLAAALFAVHPVNVDIVAWISQQPRLWSAAFALCSFLVYLRFTGLDRATEEQGWLAIPSRRSVQHLLVLGLFLCAIWCSASSLALPACFLVILSWKRGRLSAREVLLTLPMFLASAIWGMTMVFLEVVRFGARGPDFPGVVARLQIAAGAVV